MIRPVVVAALLSVASFGVVSGLAGDAAAQALSARPPIKGRTHKLKIRHLSAAGDPLLGRRRDAQPQGVRGGRLHPAHDQGSEGAGEAHHRALGLQGGGADARRAEEPDPQLHAGAGAPDGAAGSAGQRRRRRRRGLHRRDEPRHRAEHVRGGGRSAPGRGAQAGDEAVLGLDSSWPRGSAARATSSSKRPSCRAARSWSPRTPAATFTSTVSAATPPRRSSPASRPAST